jgi:hypothetical protein
MNAPSHAVVPPAVALYMAVVQFLFVTTWTVYVVYLPQLLTGAGLAASLTPIILIVDQLVFMVMDIYVGVAADRAQKMLGRLGLLMVGLTCVSCLAFLLLPFCVGLGAGAGPALLGLILLWTATSSALRAPPWVLLGKYTAAPNLPRLNTVLLWGLGVGSAIAPYLGVTLKQVDARLPFVLSSLSLLVATSGIVYVERRLHAATAAPVAPAVGPAPAARRYGPFLLGVLLLAIGFQIHFAINSAPLYLKFAMPAELEWLMPVFWVGFGVAMIPGGALCKRHGALPVMALSAAIGAAGAFAAVRASSLDALVATQALIGGAWGSILMCSFTAATAAGRTGREGLALGLLFAALAFATLSRIATVMAGVPKRAALAPLFTYAPAVCWLAGALLIGVLALRESRGVAAVRAG